jgi:hypothetical protein
MVVMTRERKFPRREFPLRTAPVAGKTHLFIFLSVLKALEGLLPSLLSSPLFASTK